MPDLRPALLSTGVALSGCLPGPAEQSATPAGWPVVADPLGAPAWVVLTGESGGDGTASFLPVQVTGDRVGAAAPVRVAGAAWPRPGEHARVVAASDGRGRFAVVTAREGTRPASSRPGDDDVISVASMDGAWSVTVQPVDGSPPLVVPVPGLPAAVHLAGRALFVGTYEGVLWVDLLAAAPQATWLATRPLGAGKAFDLFASDGDLVIAIDDVVAPIYAESFQLDANGIPTPLASFELPRLINGSYHAAALRRSGPGTGTLFVLASYGVMDGSGQILAALPVEHGAVRALDGPLNSGAQDDVPVWEEHRDRATGAVSRLAWGDDSTPWTNVAATTRDGVADRVIVAAGDRGALSFRADLLPDTAAGQCLGAHPAPVLDVLARGDRLWVLAGEALHPSRVFGIAEGAEVPIPLPPGDWSLILR